MHFFKSIAELQISAAIKIAIQKTGENELIVSLLVEDNACGDDARKLIPPLVLKGTPEELDEGFFPAIEAPVKGTAGLLTNMEAYLKAREEAKRQSAIEKDRAEKEKKEKEVQKKKYNEALEKATVLEREGKYREAWTKIPEPDSMPLFADQLRKKREELFAKFSQPGLF